MKPVFRSEMYGSNFAWYAIDQVGCLAEFVAGYAPIPKAVLRDDEMVDRIGAYFENLHNSTTSILSESAARIASECHADFLGPLESSRKGLFPYDEVRYGPVYECFAIPERPITISSLDAEVLAYIQPITFHELIFSQTRRIDVTKYFECAYD